MFILRFDIKSRNDLPAEPRGSTFTTTTADNATGQAIQKKVALNTPHFISYPPVKDFSNLF